MLACRGSAAAATGGLLPDVTVYLDITADEGLERKRPRLQLLVGETTRQPGRLRSSLTFAIAPGTDFIIRFLPEK